jgi:hypothetical protein
VSNNRLVRLPSTFSRLVSLTALHANKNNLDLFGFELCALTALRQVSCVMSLMCVMSHVWRTHGIAAGLLSYHFSRHISTSTSIHLKGRRVGHMMRVVGSEVEVVGYR